MKYNFDTVIDRRNTKSLKWDVAEGELPMWVADMDFETAPCVKEAICARAAHGVYGYTDTDLEWRLSYCNWWKTRHGLVFEPQHLIFVTGILPLISSAVRKLTTPGENVLVQTPVFNYFFNSITNNGRNILTNPLIMEDGEVRMDFEDLEEKLANPQTSLMLLCNPQNPTGKIWDRETLARVGELCKKHHVTVLSDEIHCDLTDPGKEYVPFATASETCREISITAFAPTKAFNLAGIHTAAAMVYDPVLRHKLWRGVNTDEVGEPGVFAVEATIAAFRDGEEWLNELRQYLFENKEYAKQILATIPEAKLYWPEATYLLWVDFSALCEDTEAFTAFLREKTGLFITEGKEFGANGKPFVRINVACPRAALEDGLDRLKRGIELYKNQ